MTGGMHSWLLHEIRRRSELLVLLRRSALTVIRLFFRRWAVNIGILFSEGVQSWSSVRLTHDFCMLLFVLGMLWAFFEDTSPQMAKIHLCERWSSQCFLCVCSMVHRNFGPYAGQFLWFRNRWVDSSCFTQRQAAFSICSPIVSGHAKKWALCFVFDTPSILKLYFIFCTEAKYLVSRRV